ncbi:MAG: VWA domain-containing protein [Candidatus Cloacimonetes bacterium]|nr:VWA domain-containing protein [Candidatus Cloacimonadota bacterium]
MRSTFFVIVIMILFLSCEKDPSKPEIVQNVTSISFANILEHHKEPSVVRYHFSLRDQNNHAVALTQQQINSQISATITEDDIPIDKNETDIIIHNADNLDLELVLVLDFTYSITQFEGAAEKVEEGALALINQLSDQHQIAIVEFHDNNPASNFSVLFPLSSDKVNALTTLNHFFSEDVYNGFSVCWDAVYAGLEQFTTNTDENDTTVRILMFLSDGSDTSSQNTPQNIVTYAIEKNVNIYNIGFGNITLENEATLADISNQTGGIYYSSPDTNTLETSFSRLLNDLEGNYLISYITARVNTFICTISLDYNGISTSNPISTEINGEEIFGDNRKGLLSIQDLVFTGSDLSFKLYADFIPRDITEIRILADTGFNSVVNQIDAIDGGLIENWTINQTDDNRYIILNGDMLKFGDCGGLLEFNFTGINSAGVNIPFLIDNSIYPTGVFFYGGDNSELDSQGNWSKEIIAGFTVGNPSPQNNSINVEIPVNLSWEIFNIPSDSISVHYNVYLDTVNQESMQLYAEQLNSSSFTVNDLSHSVRYFWKIVAFYGSQEIESNIWEFVTIDSEK